MHDEQNRDHKPHSYITDKYARFMSFCANKPAGVAVTVALMLALTFIVNFTGAPNPNMILVTGLVICATLFGYTGGLPAAVIMMAYTLAFFSTGHDFTTFSEQNMQKVMISGVGIVVITFFVSTLHLVVTRAMLQLQHMAEDLEEDNKLLEAATAVDSLTGVRNRFGLRRDFTDYLNCNLNVAMIDIDEFKALNDTYGHQVGDYALNQLGRCLVSLCGEEHVYRYGGDEFLIMCPTDNDKPFAERIEKLQQSVSAIEIEGDGKVRCSVGYTYGKPAIQSDLRLMIRQADANLYESKSTGKNRATGCAFSRVQAQNAHPDASRATGRAVPQE